MKPVAIRLAFGAAVLAVVGACAPMTWTRPGTSAETAQADRIECRAIAARQADALAFRRGLIHPFPLHRWRHGRYGFDADPFGDDFYDSPFDDPFFLAHELERECLRAKGYRLTPVPAGG
ncbi:MAG: hypothetical protein WD673_08110 [Alphaproteobacteria bacterium]